MKSGSEGEKRSDVGSERWMWVHGVRPTSCSIWEALEEASLVEVLGKEELARRSRKAYPQR